MSLFCNAIRRLASCVGLQVGVALAFVSTSAHAEVVDGLIQVTFNDNGAWSWFEDERAIITNGKLIVGSVADASGSGGQARNGNVEVATYDFSNADVSRFVLSPNLESDDHNSPALHVRPDGRILAVYAKHGTDPLTRWRITDNPGDTTSWTSEQTYFNANSQFGTTYSNVYRLSSENGGNGRTYNFTRTVGWDPNALISDDEGSTWSYGGRLMDEPGRPYLKYASNNVDEIHFITTERHPDSFNNGIYHGYIKAGQEFQSDGTFVANFDSVGESPTDFTQIFAGSPSSVAWTNDLALDDSGNPYLVFSVQKDGADGIPGAGFDHRYHYARWDGTQWHENEIAFGGTKIQQTAADDYAGLATVDPDDPNIVYISTDADPVTGSALISSADGQRHHEIYKGVTDDFGATWAWSPITENSTVDNVRPIVPKSDGTNSAVLWLAGTYTNWNSDWDLDVVGITTPAISPPPFGDLNEDNVVDLDDFILFAAGMHTDLSGLTEQQAYLKGDLNGDFLNNYQDFLLFRDAFNDFNGAGALSALANLLVPEPNTLVLSLAAILCLCRRSRFGSKNEL